MSHPKPAKSNSRKAAKYRGAECLNCGHPLDLSDVYCSYCSQLNSTKKLSYKDFFSEFFDSIISYDSRFRKTLVTLIFRPGRISREYVEGKRMKYANPFRFYLSISIVFFILWGAKYNFDDLNFEDPPTLQEMQEKGLKLAVDGVPVEDQAILDSIISENANQQISLDSILKSSIKKDSLITYKDVYYSESDLKSEGLISNLDKRFTLYQQYYKDSNVKRPNRGLDSLEHTSTAYHRWIYKKAVDSNDISKNIGNLITFFVKQLPFIIFFFLPVFALFIWLLYVRRKFTYTDHLVFLFHIQTMFFVLFGVVILISFIFPEVGAFMGIMTLIFLFYLYKAMRKFYQQGRFKTIVKFMLLQGIFIILAGIGSVFAFAFSFATY